MNCNLRLLWIFCRRFAENKSRSAGLHGLYSWYSNWFRIYRIAHKCNGSSKYYWMFLKIERNGWSHLCCLLSSVRRWDFRFLARRWIRLLGPDGPKMSAFRVSSPLPKRVPREEKWVSKKRFKILQKNWSQSSFLKSVENGSKLSGKIGFADLSFYHHYLSVIYLCRVFLNS